MRNEEKASVVRNVDKKESPEEFHSIQLTAASVVVEKVSPSSVKRRTRSSDMVSVISFYLQFKCTLSKYRLQY